MTIRDKFSVLYLYPMVLITSFALFYYYIIVNPHVLYSRATDASYYISIARSLGSGMGLFDLTSIPMKPIVTTQNGIALVEFIVGSISASNNKVIFAWTAFINYLSLLCTSVLLHKLTIRLEVPKLASFLIVVNVLLSINVFTALITPTNDGIALTLALLCILLAINNHENESAGKYIAVILITIVGTHFRFQNVLIPMCCVFTSLMLGKYRSSVIYSVAVFLALACIYYPYRFLIDDGTGINNTFNFFINYALSGSAPTLLGELSKGLTVLYLKFGEGRGNEFVETLVPISNFLIIIVVYFCLKIITQLEFASSLVAFVLLSTITLVLLTPAPSFRYLIIIYVLLMTLVGAQKKSLKWFAPVLAVYLLYGTFVFSVRATIIEPLFFVQARYTEALGILVEKQIPIMSEVPRVSYLIFDKPSGLPYGELDDNNPILIFGSTSYIERTINYLNPESRPINVVDFGKHWIIGLEQFGLMKLTFQSK